MKNLRLIAGILSAFAFALLVSACTSVQAGATRIRELHTYAIVAVDDQGVLSQSDLAKIRIGIVQYLTDEGWVRSGQMFTEDVVHADMVFRVRIAWMDAGKSFAVTEVAPTYGGGGAPVTEYAAVATEPYVPLGPTIRGSTTILTTATAISTVPTPHGSLPPSPRSTFGTITGIRLLLSSIVRRPPMACPSIINRGKMPTPAIRRARPRMTMRSAISPCAARTIQRGTIVRRSRRRPPGARTARMLTIGGLRRMPPARARPIPIIIHVEMRCRPTRNARPLAIARLPPARCRTGAGAEPGFSQSPRRQIPPHGVHGTRVRLTVHRLPPGNTPAPHRPIRHLHRRPPSPPPSSAPAAAGTDSKSRQVDKDR